MKVFLLSEYSGAGGGETFLLNAARGMIANGIDAVMVVPQRGELVRRCDRYHIPVRAVGQDLYGKKSLLSYLLKVSGLLMRERPDVVLFNGQRSLYLCGAVSRFFGSVNLWVCHGPWLSFSPIKKFLLRRLPQKVLTPTQELRDFLRLNAPVRCGIAVLPLPIICSDYACDAPAPDNSRITIGVIARFQKVKGQDLFIRAIEELKGSKTSGGPGAELRVILAGGTPFGDDEAVRFQSEVHRQIGEAGLERTIELAGEVGDVPELLKKLDILVVPSRYESYGMVILEAMAAGRLVLSSAVEGPKRLISDGVNGFLFPPEDSSALAASIRYAVSHFASLEGVRKNAAQFSRQFDGISYDWNSILSIK